MRYTRLLLLLVFPVALVSYGLAAADTLLGTWLNQEKDAKIQIYKCGEKYCGKIVWLKEPIYPDGSKLGTPGTPKLDDKNSDPAMKKRPVMGMEIMQGFQFAGEDSWKDGKIYDPNNGKTYSAKVKLVSPTELALRGYIGISMIGRTDKWTKAE